ncbi:hypothetical protein BDP27DRAFT_1472037 [Rhodocollybia butyracea]|uniref:Uncharacterized protein n=1 Tax=Rhodocollybia butyracea TaxID=206335 RepID=A0A9P5PEY8_9AGAR|nr:hypothetical protein BDP27DRAFT_1472037 [Rhodocollybia butyracea]
MYHASLKPKRSFVPLSEKDSVFSKPLFSFIAPSAGMFVWLKLSLEDHPSFSSLGYKALEMKFRTKLRKLVFSSRQVSITPVEVEDDTPGTGNFRIKLQRLDENSCKILDVDGLLATFFFPAGQVESSMYKPDVPNIYIWSLFKTSFPSSLAAAVVAALVKQIAPAQRTSLKS